MRDALHFIISGIVDNPDSVKIDEHEEDGMTQFVVTVAPEDMGKVIGKEGRVIRSIRNIMKIPAVKNQIRINISLNDAQK